MILLKEEQNVPLIDVGRCSGCGRCVAVCPLRIITLKTSGYRKHAVITATERCTACGRCFLACPINVICQGAQRNTPVI